jgi:hypothetical protein
MTFGVNIAHIVQRPARLGAVPVAICNEAAAITKDAFIAAAGVWSLLQHSSTTGMKVWGLPDLLGMASAARRSWVNPTERAYAAASSDYVQDARRVIDALRFAAEDESGPCDDPLASSWDDVVRLPAIDPPTPPSSVFAPRPFGGAATSA